MEKQQIADQLVNSPRETLSVEIKQWLNIGENGHKAIIAKAVIAIANHGGGNLIIGFEEQEEAFLSTQRPDGYPVITTDGFNQCIRRFLSIELHCEVYSAVHVTSGVEHPVVFIPGGHKSPIFSRRGVEGNALIANRCYVRRPGPSSAEPESVDDWNQLLDRCLFNRKSEMIDGIRQIVLGVETADAQQAPIEQLDIFMGTAHQRWAELVAQLEDGHPAKLEHGFVALGVAFVDAGTKETLAEIEDVLSAARTRPNFAWPPFRNPGVVERKQYPYEDNIECWEGSPAGERGAPPDPEMLGFWRASRSGMLFSVAGFWEDAGERFEAGNMMDYFLPILRMGEKIMFVERYAREFGHNGDILLKYRFEGLKDRTIDDLDIGAIGIVQNGVSVNSIVESSGQFTLQQISENLPEVLHKLLVPFYESFSLMRLELSVVARQVQRLREVVPR